jgi:hypothetical protein
VSHCLGSALIVILYYYNHKPLPLSPFSFPTGERGREGTRPEVIKGGGSLRVKGALLPFRLGGGRNRVAGGNQPTLVGGRLSLKMKN